MPSPINVGSEDWTGWEKVSSPRPQSSSVRGRLRPRIQYSLSQCSLDKDFLLWKVSFWTNLIPDCKFFQATLEELDHRNVDISELARCLSTPVMELTLSFAMKKELDRMEKNRMAMADCASLVKYEQLRLKPDPEKPWYRIDLSDVETALKADTKSRLEQFATNAYAIAEDFVMNTHRKAIFDLLDRMEEEIFAI